jgi:SAM-dependent methyltransferase
MMQELSEHYRQLLLRHGDTAEAAQWGDRLTQEKRFAILVEIANLSQSRILDFGCGTGHLATYLKAKNIHLNYTGVDLVEEALVIARNKHPEHHFCDPKDLPNDAIDYVLISGVFNNKIADNRSFYQETIAHYFSLAQKGLAFNMLSSYVDYREPDLFYEYPEEVFKFLKTQISPYVTIRNDYQIKDNIIPFEFTAYLYRKHPGLNA